jgi:hypothetical protein
MRLVGRQGSVFLTSLILALSWLTYLALTCLTCLADRGGRIKPVSVSTKITERHPNTQWQTCNGTSCACVESKSRGSFLTCLLRRTTLGPEYTARRYADKSDLSLHNAALRPTTRTLSAFNIRTTS